MSDVIELSLRMAAAAKIKEFFSTRLWRLDVSEMGRRKGFAVKTLRLMTVALRDVSEGQLNLRAMSLVYTTLLSLVPLLAVSFSVLKAFGVHNQIQPFLYNFLAPLGPKGAEITARVIGFVENMKVGVLGSVGLALLIYTVISLMRKIEAAINSILKIKRSRSFARRFSDYMSVILVGPVLIFSAISLTASLQSSALVQRLVVIEPFGTAFYFAGRLMPYLFVIAAFTFIYIFVPSVKVRFRSALVGGVFAGLLWETVGWGFARFIVTSTKYVAIYSGFAILILFMVWLYLNWLILLLGAGVSFYHQYPQFLLVKKEALLLSNRLRERLAFVIMFLVGRSFYDDKPPWTLDRLVDRLGLPLEPVQEVLGELQQKHLLLETGEEPPAYIPARAIETIKLCDILDAVRAAEEGHYRAGEDVLAQEEVDGVLSAIDDSICEALGERSLLDLLKKRPS